MISCPVHRDCDIMILTTLSTQVASTSKSLTTLRPTAVFVLGMEANALSDITQENWDVR